MKPSKGPTRRLKEALGGFMDAREGLRDTLGDYVDTLGKGYPRRIKGHPS